MQLRVAQSYDLFDKILEQEYIKLIGSTYKIQFITTDIMIIKFSCFKFSINFVDLISIHADFNRGGRILIFLRFL